MQGPKYYLVRYGLEKYSTLAISIAIFLARLEVTAIIAIDLERSTALKMQLLY
jgi:hypothetical protein